MEDSQHYLRSQWFSLPALDVAPALIGCTIFRRLPDGRVVSGIIAETEAYLETEPASHSFRGRTARNQVMFGPPGFAYVYFIYGMHHCLNVVTGKENEGEAVLLRALELEDHSKKASGPGRMARYLDLDLSWNGVELNPSSGLWIVPRPQNCTPQLEQTPRIGISKSVDLPWRWCLSGSAAVTAFRKQKSR